MPIFEYRCESCGCVREVIQRKSSARALKCADCGGKMSRIISPSAFILKGSGWYVTDYPSKSRKAAMEKEKKASACAGERKKVPKKTKAPAPAKAGAKA